MSTWQRLGVVVVVWMTLGFVAVDTAGFAATADLQTFEFRKGIVLGLFHQDPSINYRKDIDDIAALGCNSISLSFVLFQDDYDSSFIYVKPGRTAPDERIRESILYARQKGMRVMLFPYLLLENPSDGKWRGALAPKDEDAWWESYQAHMVHYAQIAQECGAELLSIGSELASMEKHVERWRELIKQCRNLYGGMLTYTANWDHRDLAFWDDLDLLAVSSYFEIAESKDPTLEELIEGWEPFVEDLKSWHARTAKGKPMIFAEVGYPSVDGAAEHPWDYTQPDPVDVEEQALCYEAFRHVWTGSDFLGGVYFYAWFEEGGPNDRNYTPKGKPAEVIIRDWYTSMDSPTTSTVAQSGVDG